MQELFNQLGIDWKLLLSQAVNFILLLLVLTFLIYKPLLRIMKERKVKIELGMRGAEEAALRIAQAEKIKKEKIAEAEKQAVSIIKDAEESALKAKEQIAVEAREKSDTIISDAAQVAERRRIEQLQKLLGEAKQLIKEAITRTVYMKPAQVDEKLIEQALSKIKKEKSL